MELVISTATDGCSVALLDGEAIVAERHEVIRRGHAERLIPMIAALPGRGRASAILVDCGPGSFTGIRVGIAAAKALALAWRAELSGVSTFAILAAAVEDDVTDVGLAMSGGHGELFVQSFGMRPLAPLGAIMSLPPEAAATHVASGLVLGSGAEALVAARGYGEARSRWPRAVDARLLPASLRGLPPTPIYGRTPDAKAMP